VSSVAERLRIAREQAGLSQGQVARILGLHRPTISEIEAGRRRVTAEETATFARLYEVSVAWLTARKRLITISMTEYSSPHASSLSSSLRICIRFSNCWLRCVKRKNPNRECKRACKACRARSSIPIGAADPLCPFDLAERLCGVNGV
jgi:transcriptional regulator with XRE-family HTH domain